MLSFTGAHFRFRLGELRPTLHQSPRKRLTIQLLAACEAAARVCRASRHPSSRHRRQHDLFQISAPPQPTTSSTAPTRLRSGEVRQSDCTIHMSAPSSKVSRSRRKFDNAPMRGACSLCQITRLGPVNWISIRSSLHSGGLNPKTHSPCWLRLTNKLASRRRTLRCGGGDGVMFRAVIREGCHHQRVNLVLVSEAADSLEVALVVVAEIRVVCD